MNFHAVERAEFQFRARALGGIVEPLAGLGLLLGPVGAVVRPVFDPAPATLHGFHVVSERDFAPSLRPSVDEESRTRRGWTTAASV